MRLTLHIDIDPGDTLYYTEIARAINKTLPLYHDAVSVGAPPVPEDSGIVLDGAHQIGTWQITETPAPEPSATNAAFIQVARNNWANDELEIDDSPKVAPARTAHS